MTTLITIFFMGKIRTELIAQKNFKEYVFIQTNAVNL